MTERVYAVHKVTGLITQVLPTEIDEIPALELATKKQIAEAQTAREIEVYGEPIKNGVIPEGPTADAGKAAAGERASTTDGAATNG